MKFSHAIWYEYAGELGTRNMTPTCSCGWRGETVPASNDHKKEWAIDEAGKHLRCAKAHQKTEE